MPSPCAFYRAFGLVICSEISIEALEPASSASSPDLTIAFSDESAQRELAAHFSAAAIHERRPTPQSALRIWRGRNDGAFLFEYDDGTWFHLDRVTWRIVTGWPSEYTSADMATYLLGPVMGFVLRLKGIVCLHASSAAIGGHAIAFLGSAGAGKSTLAAALALGGVPVLGDDILAIDEDDDAFMVRPGYPRLRLWPESVAGLLGDPDRLPRISPSWDKRHLNLATEGRRFQDQPLPLGAAYILGDRDEGGDRPLFERLAPSEALIALTGNGYVSYLLDRAQLAREFDFLSRLVARVPVWRLRAPADLGALPEFCQRIIEHVARQRQSVAAR